MMKRNRKGIELSINFIILMILGLLLLIIASYFIYKGLGDAMLWAGQFPKLDIPPDEDNPVQFVPRAIERDKANKMTIGFYNGESRDIPKSTIPKIECVGISAVQVRASGIIIPMGQTGTYSALINIPGNTIPTTYTCTMTISKTEKTFFMDVK